MNIVSTGQIIGAINLQFLAITQRDQWSCGMLNGKAGIPITALKIQTGGKVNAIARSCSKSKIVGIFHIQFGSIETLVQERYLGADAELSAKEFGTKSILKA